MKLTVPSTRMQTALAQTKTAVPTRATLPILAGVHLETEGSDLVLTTSNLDQSIMVRLPATVKVQGRLVVSHERLLGFFQRLPDAEVRMETRDGVLVLAAGKSRAELRTMAADDFPATPLVEQAKEPDLVLSGADLALIADRVAFAAENLGDSASTRYKDGISFRFAEQSMRVMGTSGFRFSGLTFPSDTDPGTEEFLLHREAVERLAKLYDEEDLVSVYRDGNQMLFRAGARTMVLRTMQDDYAAYEPVLNGLRHGVDRSLTVDRAALVQALQRVAVVAAGAPVNPVRLDAGETTLRLYTATEDAGEAAEEVEAEREGGEWWAAFNAQYLLGALTHMVADQVRIEMDKHPHKAILIRPAEDGDVQHELVVVPINPDMVWGWDLPPMNDNARQREAALVGA